MRISRLRRVLLAISLLSCLSIHLCCRLTLSARTPPIRPPSAGRRFGAHRAMMRHRTD